MSKNNLTYNEDELIKFVSLNTYADLIINIIRDPAQINDLMKRVGEAEEETRYTMCVDFCKPYAKSFNKMIKKYRKDNHKEFTMKIKSVNKYLKAKDAI